MWTCKSELECPEMDKRLLSENSELNTSKNSKRNKSTLVKYELAFRKSDVKAGNSRKMKSPGENVVAWRISFKKISLNKSAYNLLLFVGLICIITLQLNIKRCDAFSIDATNSQKTASLTVDYYEPVYYNPTELLSQHRRKKREVGNKESLKVNLFSKSRNFNLHLSKDKSIFHPEVVIENSVGPVNYDTSRVLAGHLEDDPGSLVEGLITSEGEFDGLISTGEGLNFFIEPINRYSNIHRNSSQGIIYESDSIQWPSPPPICASHELHLNRKFHTHEVPQDETESSSSSSDEHTIKTTQSNNDNYSNNDNFDNTPLRNPIRHLGSPFSTTNSTSQIPHHHHTKRRRNKRYVIDPKRKTCMLYLQADHLFYNHFGSEEAAINMMARHIQRVNEIYRTTDFDGDGQPDGITFMIKRIKVHNMNHTLDPNYKYMGDFQVIKFLERFSEGDYESFCLAYMFTFRDFEGGTLGLAWTGDLKNAGGVCERKGHFRGGLKSLNTGIITLLNYGKVVLPAVSYVTLAHEIGHNFGSPHDPDSDKECVPGGKDGNYIMYARATAGDQKNNQRFSPCSLRNIIPVLNTKARNIHGCFTEPQTAICGNREVEEGEECDCGWEEDCTEPCCWPMKMRYDPVKEIPCTLKPKKECSPSQGPCCTGNCTLKIGDKCRDDNGCRHTAKCDGYMPTCPPSVHKPNKTVCHEEQNVCFMGECTGSICLAYGLESCQCSPQPWDSASKLCELCCKKPGEGQPCISSFEWNDQPYDVPNLFSKPGSPCKNYTGYCDSYHTCREVDPSGPLATLRNLLLADEGLTAIAEWIDAHWYAVISFIVLLIIMMILTAKLCGKQAKKKLRKITVLHSNVEAIQVERSYWDESGEHVVHPAAIRKKIPLRKKIREKKSKSSKSKSKNRPTRSGGASGNSAGGGGGAADASPGGGGGPGGVVVSSSKGLKYGGTLWKKKRGERTKLPNSSSRQNKTETSSPSAALNGNNNLQSPTSPGSSQQQTFDLVQLQTPPVASSSNSSGRQQMVYPVLESSSSEQKGPAVGGSPGIRAGTTGESSSPKSPQILTAGSSIVGDPLAAALVNHHEAKTAIVPSSGGKRVSKRKSSKRPSSTREHTSGGGHISKSRISSRHKSSASRLEQHSSNPHSSRSKSGSQNTRTSSSAKKEKPTKKGIQIVYTPPFSLKVVQVDSPGTSSGSNNNNKSPSGATATATTGEATSNSNNSNNVPPPSGGSPGGTNQVSNASSQQVPKSSSSGDKKEGRSSKKNRQESEGRSNSKSPPVSGGPPPYSKMIDRPLPPIVETISPSDEVPAKKSSEVESSSAAGDSSKHSSQQQNNIRVKSKVKSSGSFLQRRKGKNNEKSELRVLIPPANQEEDDNTTTPVTPMH